MEAKLVVLQNEVIDCSRCERLVEWRNQVAREKVRRFAQEDYWGRAVPSFGDPRARLLIVGLAPAAHGANRTGRMFTGDRSGEWLYRALHRAGFASQPHSTNRSDGLLLIDCYITAVIHCAPPRNKPLKEEIENCRRFLLREIELLSRVRVVMALGGIAFEAAIRAFGLEGERRKFSHGVECRLRGGKYLLVSYHPSQQNTFTGRLTEDMLDRVVMRARAIIAEREM
ncbi:MAG: uracil-DNA glycosylase [Acidobacteriota bacterium]